MVAGRKPKITNTRRIHRSNDELEKIVEMTPVCESQNFIAPKSLNAKELIIWNDLVKILKSVHGSYISDADIMTMEIYCKSKAEYDKACIAWEKNPQMYVQILNGGFNTAGEPKAQLKVNPNYQIKKDFANIMLKYLDQLGISPLGRARQGKQATNNKMQEEKEQLLSLLNRSEE